MESSDHCSEITRKIARAGTFGKHASNIERDICRSLEIPVVTGHTHYDCCLAGCVMPLNYTFVDDDNSTEDIHHVDIPVKDPETRRGRSTFRLPFLMAHELMDYFR